MQHQISWTDSKLGNNNQRSSNITTRGMRPIMFSAAPLNLTIAGGTSLIALSLSLLGFAHLIFESEQVFGFVVVD
jgi:hypothetical protein